MKNTKIAIIGCGNLGQSILNGIIDTPTVNPRNIFVTKRNLDTIKAYEAKGVNISNDNISAVKNAELIILALKPYTILHVLEEIAPFLNKEKHTIVSLATAITLNQIKEKTPNDIPIFRAMPNTAADVGMSITCICSQSKNSKASELVTSCFNSVGTTITVDENLMDSATVLGACGIAYALRFIRGMIQGGIQIGFDAKTATKIAIQTVKGASELLIENNTHPEYEIDKVTTPKGCTIAGLNEMEHNGFSSALIKGIVTSFEKI